MDWTSLIIPIISGFVTIAVTMSKTKPNIKKEESDHANVLFEQYKERVKMLQDDVVDREKRIRELQDDHEVELEMLREKINELEETIAMHKQEILELEYKVKMFKLELEAHGIELENEYDK